MTKYIIYIYTDKVAPVLNKHYAMKTYEEVDVRVHTFCASALVTGKWSASRLGRFTPDNHWI
jgi:hypothetical protein